MKTKTFLLICSLFLFMTKAQKKDVFNVARNGTLQEMSELAKQNPALVNTTDQMGFSPLILACYRGNVEVAEFLIDHVKDLNYESREGTALAALSINYNKDLVEKLLQKGANPNTVDSQGNTPLLWAIKRNNLELLQLLLKNNANTNVKDSLGISAFEYAVKSNNSKIINLLKN